VLTPLALVAIAAGMTFSAGTLVMLWIDSRKQDTKSNDD
jgi:hypothetical protein